MMDGDHYYSLRVKERTRRLAKELSAMQGKPIKDFLQDILEREKNNQLSESKRRREIEKKLGFSFRW